MIQVGKYCMKHAELFFLTAALVWLFFMNLVNLVPHSVFSGGLALAGAPVAGLGIQFIMHCTHSFPHLYNSIFSGYRLYW